MCVLAPYTPSASTLPADVVFSTFTRFIAGSFRTSTLIRYILRGYFNINEGTPVNKSFPDRDSFVETSNNPPPDLNCWNGVPSLQQGLSSLSRGFASCNKLCELFVPLTACLVFNLRNKFSYQQSNRFVFTLKK